MSGDNAPWRLVMIGICILHVLLKFSAISILQQNLQLSIDNT